MAVYQCKMCGGALDVSVGTTVCRCGFCGSVQSLPRLGVDKRAGLLERAEQYRRGNEYDKAMSLFEQLLADDSSDADIYWSIVLCRYGIEYVEDPSEHKRIPTVNRTHYRSILSDEDYSSALRYADEAQREVYTAQAAEIDRLQKKILLTSQAEEPFDIFLCYKETDSRGKRTEDSVLADGLYHQLDAKGYRVFFSRVTLEDKIGTEYEPYIFAALNSARVMIVLGTRREHISAVWVRNEWSRYLALASDNPQKTLIAVYKGIGTEVLPEEFAHLQAFDMSDPGFEQDLLRGIAKLVPAEGRKSEQTTVIQAAPASAGSLIRRAYLFLEEGNFVRADELCERALNAEPENAEAYFVKLLAECGLVSAEKLNGLKKDLSQSDNFEKAMRFADKAMQARLTAYYKQALYNQYLYEFGAAFCESQFAAIAERFRELDFADSAQKAEECERKAEELREAEKEKKYARASAVLESSEMITELDSAKTDFNSLGGYKQSAELAQKCAERINELKAEKEQKRREESIRDRMLLLRQKKLSRRIRLTAGIGALSVAAVIAVGVIISNVNLSGKYNRAVELRESNNFDEAISLFVELGDYSDAAAQINQTRYLNALYLKETGDYDGALLMLIKLGNYSDSEQQITEIRYTLAENAFAQGDYGQAMSLYSLLGDYSGSAEKLLTAKYKNAVSLGAERRYDDAVALFRELGDYSDSAAQADRLSYEHAVQLREENRFDEAERLFSGLGEYSDAAEQLLLTNYQHALYESEHGDTAKAIYLLEELGTYSDANEQARRIRYDAARAALDSGDYEQAISLFGKLGSYSDAKQLQQQARYDYAAQLESEGNFEDAVKVLRELNSTVNVSDRINEVQYNYAMSMIESGNYEKAIALLEGLGSYADSSEQILRAKYTKAVDLRENHFFDDAIALFRELGSYSDSYSQIAVTERAKFTDAQPGDTITFGSYLQHNLSSIGSEDIQWLVLERDGTKALVISRYVIDVMPFGADTWEKSTVRTWLNNDFIDTAFTAGEQARLCYTEIHTADNERYGTYGGADTSDRVFLLSDEEAYRYLRDAYNLKAKPTRYCNEKSRTIFSAELPEGTTAGSSTYTDWWLRSPGGKFGIMRVSNMGRIPEEGEKYDYQRGGVRPAMWIELE